uniref:Secreted protein n=1 Tax=Phakopsora pachyrhizi TaxID=170000 RepID=A0A0S1MID6_PHAPC
MTSLAFFYFLKLMTLATLANGMTSSNKDLALSSCLLSPKAYHNKFEGQSATLHLMPSSSLIEEHTTNDGLNPEVKLIDFWKINESKKRTFDGWSGGKVLSRYHLI